jgi:hypothetical protein
LAPVLAALRAAGIRDVRQLAGRLNERGLTAPSGRPFSYGTMHRILVRLKKLRLGDGPQSLVLQAQTAQALGAFTSTTGELVCDQ